MHAAAISRRDFIRTGAVTMAGAKLLRGGGVQRGGQPESSLQSIKAAVFDTFGTVVDWRTSVALEVEGLAKRKSLSIDGAKFADAWRAQYQPKMNLVRTGQMPWTNLDHLHRMILDGILQDFGIKGLTEAETAELNRAWHRLHPWPDSVNGLTRLKK